MAHKGITKCRICLTEMQNMKLLTADYLVCGELLQISHIITSCTDIEIVCDDRLPNCICNDCLQDANIAYSFKKRCEKSEIYLKSQLENLNEIEKDNPNFTTATKSQFNCVQCSVKFTTQTDYDKHVSASFCENEIISNKHVYTTNTTYSLRAMRKSTKKSLQNISSPTHSDGENSEDTSVIKEEMKYEENSSDEFMSESADLETKSNKEWYKILKYSREKNDNGLYECICCPQTFSEFDNVRKHIQTHNSFKCKLCKKKFTLVSNLRRHLKLHDNSETKFNSCKENISSTEFKCIACQEVFSRRKFLSEHLRTHKEFKCPTCNAKFTYATNLRKHIKWHNKPPDAFKVWKQAPVEKRTCDICFKIFKYRPSMLKHRKKHEYNGKECKFCDQVFENSIKLYKHMEENHEHEKNIICSVCGKKFFKEWNLKMHMIVHTGVKSYMCEICGASFALGGNLASHKRLHTGQKPYKCSTCGRGFTQQAALRSHEAGHSDRRDFICPDCGAAFSRAGAMRNHRKRHQANRPFACEMCGKRFTFSSERKRHMTIHTGEMNHICDICGKAFNRPTNLTVHRRIHTRECLFTCDVCGLGFVQAHCMRTHRNTHKEATKHITQEIASTEESDLIKP